MNEQGRFTQPTDAMMKFVAKRDHGASHSGKEATPQQIGDVVSEFTKRSDESNADEPTLLERLGKHPEGILLILGATSIGAAILSSEPFQKVLQHFK